MTRLMTLMTIVLLLTGCATMRGEVADGVQPLVATTELDGLELLDVAIEVFDSEKLTNKQVSELGLSPEIRQAEERYIPIHLKYTMQRTGYWGAVRVVPEATGAPLLVRGTILQSDGHRLSLEIEALDARGVTWFEKAYSEELGPVEYAGLMPGQKDPYQDLYNTIANDLAQYRNQLSAADFSEIQQIAELRHAADMAPDAFAGHLARNDDGRYSLVRIPAADDPMLKRVRAIQVRDAMLLDTINGYYDVYYDDLWQPYNDWRKLYNEELEALDEVEKQALTRQLLGLASVVGGVLLSSSNGDIGRSNLPGVMVVGGAAAIYSGFQLREETKIHKEAIEELSISFSTEAEPLVVEVVGETVRLTGSAEEQYHKWREMLRSIYAAETGFSLDEPGDGSAPDGS